MPRLRNDATDLKGNHTPYAYKFDGKQKSWTPKEEKDISAIEAQFLLEHPTHKSVFKLLDANTKPADWPRFVFRGPQRWVFRYDGVNTPMEPGEELCFPPEAFAFLQNKLAMLNQYERSPVWKVELCVGKPLVHAPATLGTKDPLSAYRALIAKAKADFGLEVKYGRDSSEAIQRMMLAANEDRALQAFLDLGLDLPPAEVPQARKDAPSQEAQE